METQVLASRGYWTSAQFSISMRKDGTSEEYS
jgi:hypothetical protein